MIQILLLVITPCAHTQSVPIKDKIVYKSDHDIETILIQSMLGVIHSARNSDEASKAKEIILKRLKSKDIEDYIELFFDLKGILNETDLKLIHGEDELSKYLNYSYTIRYKGYRVERHMLWRPGMIHTTVEVYGSMSTISVTQWPAKVVTSISYGKFEFIANEVEKGTSISIEADVNLTQTISSIAKCRCISKVVQKRGPSMAAKEARKIAKPRLSGTLNYLLDNAIDIAAGGEKTLFYENYIKHGLKYFNYE